MSDKYDDATVEGLFPNDRKPWERMPSETDKAYHAFRCYRDIEPSHERTVALAASIFYERPLDYYSGVQGKVIPSNFMAWKGEFAWDVRTKAYDFFRERDRMDAVQQARIEKAREEGFELASVEHILYDRYVALSEKIDAAIKNLPTDEPVWREINGAMKVANEIAANFYKITRLKHDMKDPETGGLSQEDMEGFWEKKPPNQQMQEEMEQMAEGE